MSIPSKAKADKNLENVLKPNGGGGWLDVQEALWNCYRARECQDESKQIRSKL